MNAARGTRGYRALGRIKLCRVWVTRSALHRTLVELQPFLGVLKLDEQSEEPLVSRGLLLHNGRVTYELSALGSVGRDWTRARAMI